MKKYLLILTTLFVSSSCWSQFDMNALASEHPEYATRINAVN